MFYRPFTAKAMRVVPLVIALMAIAIVLLPGDSVQGQQAATTVQYNENDTVPVIILTATDPEGASPILWSRLASNDTAVQDIPGVVTDGGADDVSTADGEDGDLFKISADGVLEFINKPDYEIPMDVTNGTNPANEYKVVVQASDGATMNWFKVNVMVMNVEEEGSVILRPTSQIPEDATDPHPTLLQPQVGVIITATDLIDSDGIVETPTYKWYRTSNRTAMGTEIDNETSLAYMPTDAAGKSDVGMYLRFVATYTDGGPSRGDKTATAVSGIRNDEQHLQQRTPDVPFGNYYESGVRGNAKGDGHRHPGHSHRRGQWRDIDLLAERGRCWQFRH